MISLKEQVVRLHKELCVKEDRINHLEKCLSEQKHLAETWNEFEVKRVKRMNQEMKLLKEENKRLKQIKNQ